MPFDPAQAHNSLHYPSTDGAPDQLQNARRLAREHEHVGHGLGRAPPHKEHVVERGAQARGHLAQPLAQQLRTQNEAHQAVVDVVGGGAGKAARGLSLLQLTELLAQLQTRIAVYEGSGRALRVGVQTKMRAEERHRRHLNCPRPLSASERNYWV